MAEAKTDPQPDPGETTEAAKPVWQQVQEQEAERKAAKAAGGAAGDSGAGGAGGAGETGEQGAAAASAGGEEGEGAAAVAGGAEAGTAGAAGEEGAAAGDAAAEGAGEGEGKPAAKRDTAKERIDRLGAAKATAEAQVATEAAKARYWEKTAKGQAPTMEEAQAAGPQYTALAPPDTALAAAVDDGKPPDDYDGMDEKDERPTRDKFDDPDEFTVELSAWGARKGQRQQRHADKQVADRETAQRQEQQRNLAWQDKVNAARAKHADFDAVLTAADGAPLQAAQAAAAAIDESEIGGEMLYYLAQHPAEVQALAGLSPVGQVRAISRIEATLQAEIESTGSGGAVAAGSTTSGGAGGSTTAPAAVQVSGAPAPPGQSGAGSGASDDRAVGGDLDNLSDADLRKRLDTAQVSTPRTVIR